MEPVVQSVDLIARYLAYTGIAIALIVAFIQVLTYIRGKRQDPRIRGRMISIGNIIISKPNLLVLSMFIDNQSTLANTIVEITAKQRIGFRSTSLNTGNLQTMFVEEVPPITSKKFDRRLSVAPEVALDLQDWALLLADNGFPKIEGLWNLPLSIHPLSSFPMIIAIASNKLKKIDVQKKLTVTFKDITYKRHPYKISIVSKNKI